MVNNHPKKQLVIGKIYADWCGHCTAMASDWDGMVRNVKLNMGRMLKNITVEFETIGDTEENKAKNLTVEKMVENFNTKYLPQSDEKLDGNKGFPTIFKLCDGKLEYYEGDRKKEAMYKWAMSGCGSENNIKMHWRGGKGGNKRSQKYKRANKTFRRKSQKNRTRSNRRSLFLGLF